MGLWANVLKVMRSDLFKKTLEEGSFYVYGAQEADRITPKTCNLYFETNSATIQGIEILCYQYGELKKYKISAGSIDGVGFYADIGRPFIYYVYGNSTPEYAFTPIDIKKNTSMIEAYGLTDTEILKNMSSSFDPEIGIHYYHILVPIQEGDLYLEKNF